MVALQATIHDGGVTLLGDALLGDLFVDPVGKAPRPRLNPTEFDGSRCVVPNSLLEVVVEFGVVEENIGIVVPSVEMPLDGFDRLNNSINLLVAGQDDKGSVGSWGRGIGLEAAGHEYFVVFFADFTIHTQATLAVCSSRGGNTFGIPNSWRRASGHQYPARGAGMPDKQHQDQDNHQHWEDQDDAQWHGDGRVAAQTQRPLEEGQSGCKPFVFWPFLIRRRKMMRPTPRSHFCSPEKIHGDQQQPACLCGRNSNNNQKKKREQEKSSKPVRPWLKAYASRISNAGGDVICKEYRGQIY